MADVYDKVMELAKRRGFVWPSSEIYGSVAGLIDYGPLGAMMKRKIENLWRDYYVAREGYFEIECPTVGEEAIYIASGHVKGFADKMVQCPHCKEYHRADHVCEAHNIEHAETKTLGELTEILRNLPCPACGKTFDGAEAHYFNLMFHTTIGPGSQRTGYLRPETAQGIFTDFGRLLRFYRDKLPFGTVQIGKSYRNEISPRQGMIRLREFTQAEAEIFVHPQHKEHPNFGRYADRVVPLRGIKQQENDEEPVAITIGEAVKSGIVANEYVGYYIALTHDFLIACGADPARIRFRQHLPDERAHYATDCWDAEVLSARFGWVEVVGIADRTDYDLKAHAAQSGDSFTAFIPYDEEKKVREMKIVADMGALGPKFKGKAKAVAELLAASKPTENGAEIVLDGEKILIPPELYKVREQETVIRGEEVRPHVIEPSYGIDRILYSVLEHAFDEEDVDGETRTVLRISKKIAPVQVAVLPLMSRDGLDTIALELMAEIQDEGLIVQYDDSGAIGRRYRRQDEIGTPFAVTVDYDTKEDNTVTLRERDSMKQIRIPKDHLVETLRQLIRGKVAFENL